MQVVIRSDSHKEMNVIQKSTKVYTAFLENIEDRLKLFEVNVLNCCLKMTMADLRKIGLKVRQ